MRVYIIIAYIFSVLLIRFLVQVLQYEYSHSVVGH